MFVNAEMGCIFDAVEVVLLLLLCKAGLEPTLLVDAPCRVLA